MSNLHLLHRVGDDLAIILGSMGGGTVETSQFLQTSQSSLFQQTSEMSDYLGVGYTTHTHPYINTSQFSLFQQTSQMSDYLGVGYTTHTHPYVNNSQSSLFQQTSGMSAYLQNSQSSLFQHTSATSNITSNAFPSAQTTKFAGTGFSGTNISGTVNSNGIQLSVNTGGGAGDGYNIIVAGGSTANNSASILFQNSNGISFGLNGTVITGTVKTDYLTTARASNDAIGLNTALTGNGVSVTANSGGLSINVPAFLTTAAATNITTNNMATTERNNYFHTSNNTFANNTHTHGNIAFSGTNVTGNFTSASNGLSIQLSAPAGGAGGAEATCYWATPPWGGGVNVNITNVTALTQRPIFLPFNNIGNLSVHEIMWPMSRSTSGSNNFTVHAGIYSFVNATSANLIGSTSVSYSHTATASNSGICLFEVLFSPVQTLSKGQYVLGMIFSATATASMNYSLMGGSTANPYRNIIHPGVEANIFTHTSHGAIPIFGRYSTTTGGLPSGVAQSHVIGAYTGASAPIPMNFTLGTHN